jgi:hypothetical protein
VVDSNNYRIQLFAIIYNQPCAATSTSFSGSSLLVNSFFKNIYSLLRHLESTTLSTTTSSSVSTTVTESSTMIITTLIPSTTTTIKSRAVSLHWNYYYIAILTLMIFSIVR